MIRELKEELSYKTVDETEEIDKIKKEDNLKEKENSYDCVVCGIKKVDIYHKGKYICWHCIFGFNEKRSKKDD